MTGKKKKTLIFILFYATLFAFLTGCGLFSSDGDGEALALYPTTAKFVLYGNDFVPNDSAAAYLPAGTLLAVHPNALYTLSFDADSGRKPPKLNLFRVVDSYVGSRTRQLSAEESNGRWYYRFLCEENNSGYWATTLEENGDYYKGTVRNVRYEAEGAYSSHFSVNLVVAGQYGGTADSVSLDSLSKLLLAGFRRYFSSEGIAVDTLFLHYASERNDVKNSYPDDEPWLAGKSSSDVFVTELGGWPNSPEEPEVYNALDLVLVHRIEIAGVLGYSILFAGNFGGGQGSTVVVGTHYMLDSRTEYSQTASEIVNTAIHECAHFLGLRHTTATKSDQAALGDYSIWEDGIADTPHCGQVLNMKMASGESENPVSLLPNVLPKLFFKNAATCPDASNPMFPAASVNTGTFTQGQLSSLAKMIPVYPH